MKLAARLLGGHFAKATKSKPHNTLRKASMATSKPRSGFQRFSRVSGSRSYSTSSSASSWNVSNWVIASVTLGGLTIGGFTLGSSSDRKDDRDSAKETYLTCIGDKQNLPLPVQDAVLTFVPEVPPPTDRDYPVTLKVDMNTTLRVLPLDDTHNYEMWTFNGGVPGPFVRGRVGDVLDVSFTNLDNTGMWHNVDFHASMGPGGGAPVLTAVKDETRSAQFKLLYPGLFIYHCAVHPVAHHIANGMYGVLLVEPEGGLPKVDKEYVIVQSEFYANEDPDDPKDPLHVVSLNEDRLNDENPSHVVFNGRVGMHVKGGEDGGDEGASAGLQGEPLTAKAGERVRIYVANAGPNLVSSFHIIGGIFDKVYREGDLISPPARGLQTTLVPSGGAAVVELVPPIPGTYTFVDHSIVRIEKGAVGFLNVEGPVCPTIYHSDHTPRICRPCKIHP